MVAKQTKNEVATLTAAEKEVKIVGIGDKMRGILHRTHSDEFPVTLKKVGRIPPTFRDAAIIVPELLNSGYEFDEESTVFNQCRYVTSYETSKAHLFP